MCVSVTLRDQETTWGLKKRSQLKNEPVVRTCKALATCRCSSQRAQISSKVAQKAVFTFKEIGLCFLFLILFS